MVFLSGSSEFISICIDFRVCRDFPVRLIASEVTFPSTSKKFCADGIVIIMSLLSSSAEGIFIIPFTGKTPAAETP